MRVWGQSPLLPGETGETKLEPATWGDVTDLATAVPWLKAGGVALKSVGALKAAGALVPKAARGVPVLLRDATGKIHRAPGERLPKVKEFKNASPEHIEEQIEELRGSILTRKQEQLRLGEHGPHRRPINEEEELLRSLEKMQEDTFGAKNTR